VQAQYVSSQKVLFTMFLPTACKQVGAFIFTLLLLIS